MLKFKPNQPCADAGETAKAASAPASASALLVVVIVLSPDASCCAPKGVVEFCRAVAIGAGCTGGATDGIAKRRHAVRVGAGAAGHATGGVAEGRGLCRGGARQRQREGNPNHRLPARFLAT